MRLDPDTALTGADRLAWIEYRNNLKVAGRSPRTIQNYGEAIAQLAVHIAPDGATVLTADRGTVTGYLLWCREEHSSSTELNRFRSLRAWYGWLAAEDIITKSPMARITCPKTEERVPRVLADAELSALLAACSAPKGAAYEERFCAARDRAVIAIWCEAGSPRLAEMAAVTTDDIDIERGHVLVHGKGSKDRLVPLSPETVRDVIRYLRARAAHKRAGSGELWLGRRPGFGMRGLAQMLADRAGQAGLGHLHPHEMRHTAFSRFKAAGGQVDDAMHLFGWNSLDMVLVYGRAAAKARSVQAGRSAAMRAGL
jgi:site-specific recombinase XerD